MSEATLLEAPEVGDADDFQEDVAAGAERKVATGDGPPPTDDHDEGGGDRDDRRWVTVAAFTSPTEAQIARLKLESEDIDCFLDNENLIAMDWLVSNAVGGVKLKVPESDAVRARELLRRAPDGGDTGVPGEPLYDGLARCPHCGSERIVRDRFSRRWAFLSILFLGLPIPFPAQGTRCTRCGAEWE